MNILFIFGFLVVTNKSTYHEKLMSVFVMALMLSATVFANDDEKKACEKSS